MNQHQHRLLSSGIGRGPVSDQGRFLPRVETFLKGKIIVLYLGPNVVWSAFYVDDFDGTGFS